MTGATLAALEPDEPVASLLPPEWHAVAGVVEALPSWRALHALARHASSDAWWERVQEGFPGVLVLLAWTRRSTLLRTLEHVPEGGRALDMACGPGVTTRLLLDAGAAEAVGVDPAMIALAHAGPADASIRFVEGDVRTRLPFADDAFDVAVLGDLYHPAAVEEARRVVRPGGVVSARMTEVVPSMLYADDPVLDATLRQCYLAGERERFGPGRQGSWAGNARADGLTRVESVLDEHVGPLAALDAAALLVTETLWHMGHARGSRLDVQTWRRWLERWDPDRDDAMPYRDDVHVVVPMTVASTVVASD